MHNSVAKAMLKLNGGSVAFPGEELIHGDVRSPTVTSGPKLDPELLWLIWHILAKLTSSFVPLHCLIYGYFR